MYSEVFCGLYMVHRIVFCGLCLGGFMKKIGIVKRRTVEFTAADEDLFNTVKQKKGIKKDADVFRTLLLDAGIELSLPKVPPKPALPPAEKIVEKTILPPPGFSKVPPAVLPVKKMTFQDWKNYHLNQGDTQEEACAKAQQAMMNGK